MRNKANRTRRVRWQCAGRSCTETPVRLRKHRLAASLRTRAAMRNKANAREPAAGVVLRTRPRVAYLTITWPARIDRR